MRGYVRFDGTWQHCIFAVFVGGRPDFKTRCGLGPEFSATEEEVREMINKHNPTQPVQEFAIVDDRTDEHQGVCLIYNS